MANNNSQPATGYFRQPLHKWLAITYGLWWLALAITPLHRGDWLLENILIVAAVALMARLYHRFPLSNASYVLIALFLAAHTYGSHYTYAETPLGFWLADVFETTRNHYDRVIHFLYGAMIYLPLREVMERAAGVSAKWVAPVAFMFIVGSSALYEMMEWAAAIVVAPDAAIAFLGVQGDVFDAQKDSALAVAGALIAMIILRQMGRRR